MTQSVKIPDPRTTVSTRPVNVALVGNPNTGKTSVFNALTGLRQKVGNYPGVTVEKKTGLMTGAHDGSVYLHDLPGLYSLIPKSLDEQIAKDVLMGESPDGERMQLAVVVMDAGNLSRNLYLVTQVIDSGIPVIVALNMVDTAEESGLSIDVDGFAAMLGVPVVPIVANRGIGIDALRRAIVTHARQPHTDRPEGTLVLEDRIASALEPVSDWLSHHARKPLSSTARLSEALRMVSNDAALAQWTKDPRYQPCEAALAQCVQRAREALDAMQMPWRMLETRLRYARIDDIYRAIVHEQPRAGTTLSQKLDRVFTHRIAGPVIVIALFALIFQTIFSWAQVPMDAIQNGINAFGGYLATMMPAGALRSLLVDGVIAGVGAVMVFLPQILFLFFFLALLEDTGYMARVAFIVDRLMRSLGLSGRSVIPLLSSFACAIPGIMATRTIANWRDRLITIMIAPLMSCSARLPVYILMIGAFIPDIPVLGLFSLPGLTLLSMYLIGMAAAVCVALAFKRFFMPGHISTSFIMELPPYRRPSLRWVFLQMIERAKIFITDAGRIILAISIVLWFLASYPQPAEYEAMSSRERIRQSYAGQLGQTIEPAIEPLGFDWKLGVGLITSFAAREVLVSTLATIYNVEEADETSVSLQTALRNERDPATGRPTYTPLVAVSLMVFFVLACQCMSTVAIVRRETNSWRWPVVMIVYMTGLAYLGSLVVYQGGQLLGLG